MIPNNSTTRNPNWLLNFLAAALLAQASNAQSTSQAPSPVSAQTQFSLTPPVLADPSQIMGPSDYAVVQTGPDSQVWQSSTGQSVTTLATGMNYWNGQQWNSSDPSFVISADGTSFVASKVEDPTTLAANLNSQGAVLVSTPDGVALSSTPTAIGLYDAASGQSVIIATLTNSIGVLADPQHVVYTNAFVGGGLSASVVYSMPDPGSFHQDVIFTAFNPNFDPTVWGFAATSTNTLQIQIFTEFYNPPQPQVRERDLYIEQDPNVRASMASPDFIDYFLDFGHYVFGPGQAYPGSTYNLSTPGVSVAKEMVTSSGRTFMVESIRYRDIVGQLQTLPPVTIKTSSLKHLPGARRMKVAAADLPQLQANKSHISDKILKGKTVALNSIKPGGVDVDYFVELSSLIQPTLYTSDTTYFVTNNVYLASPVTIESAVFKFTTNTTLGAIVIQDTLALSTTNYRPAIFTGADDNTAGSPLNTNIWSGYTGILGTNLYGTATLSFQTTSNITLNNLRFINQSLAINGVAETAGWTLNVSHSQLVGCREGIAFSSGGSGDSAVFNANNCLFAAVQYPFLAASVGLTGNVCNCTIDQTSSLTYMVSGTSGTLNFTNSILTVVAYGTTNGVTLGGGYNGFSATTSFGTPATSTTASPYQSMRAGSYYLTNTTPFLTAATTNINAALLAQLQMKTTQAPMYLSGPNYTTNTTLTPVVQRDTTGTALGFHYDPIDYWGACGVSNATLTLSSGVALAYYDNCLTWLQDGSALISQGTPNQRNYIVYFNAVQEQPVSYYPTNNFMARLLPFDPLPVGGSALPSIDLWLTTICAPTGETNLWFSSDYGGNNVISSLTLQDCEVYGSGANWEMNESANTPNVGFTNNVFYRVPFAVNSNAKITSYNNLFYGTTNANEFTNIIVYRNGAPSPNTHENDVFDGVKATLDGTVGYNAYVNGATNTSFTNNNDIITNITWQGGPLGFYYQPPTSPLLTNGSTFATNLGLYHYTVLTNESVEGTNIVSRGYHYIALGADGLPLDTYNEGVADYIRDRNGNGIYDKGDVANWLSPFTIYDQGMSYGGVYPAHVRLGYWRFNSSSLNNEAGKSPTTNTSVTTNLSWSGTSAFINTTSELAYNIVDSPNWTNLDLANGTVRFWFKPHWTSPNAGGTGTLTAFAPFLAVGDSTAYWNACWILETESFGSFMGFQADSNLTNNTAFGNGTACTFSSNHWYQLALTYSPSNMAMYINGQQIATGDFLPQYNFGASIYETDYGMFIWPSSSYTTFTLGGWGSSEQIDGEFDELETFNYPLSAQAIAYGYPTFNGANYLGITNNVQDSDYVGRSDLLRLLVDAVPSLPAPNNVTPCRLGYWRFNSSQWVNEQGQFPTSANNVSLATGWSGGALNIGSAANSGLTYPDVYTNGWANINCRQGSVRFWFQPNSVPVPSSAPFIYVGNNTSYWTLKASASGTALVLTTVSNSVNGPVVSSSPVNFQTNQWCQIVCTYGPSGSALYTNGMLAVTNGLVWTNWPDASARASGMIIGNDWTTNHPINGKFDELETFNYELNANQILTNFLSVWNIDNNLDGIPDIIQDTTLASSTAFLGQPVVVTGTIEAEQFDRGGSNVAYLNVASNPPNVYRTTGMCITTNGMPFGYCLDQTRPGEWVNYTINVLVSQMYNIEAQVQGLGTNGRFQIIISNYNGYRTSTGSMAIPSNTWTTVMTNQFLEAGTNVLTVQFLSAGLTNGVLGSYVGRFDYFTVYPWWSPPTFPTTPSNYVSGLGTGSDFLTASNNAYLIQANVNYIEGLGGGVVGIEQGTFYVAQAHPDETKDAWYNAIIGMTNSNIKICGVGTNTVLIGYNRATTMLYTSQDQGGSSPTQCTNITLQNLTLQAQPHMAVSNGSPTQVVYQRGMLYPVSGNLTGASVVLVGASASQYAYNILLTNCHFIDGDKELDIKGLTSNVLVQNCSFVQFQGNDGYTPGVWNTNILHSTNDSQFLLGIFAQDPNYNIGVVGCSYNGNPNYTNQITSNPNPTNYIANQLGAGNGLLYDQGGGNFFVLRNFITNNAEEAVQFNAGPGAVAGNTFWSWGNNNSCGAFAVNLELPGATGTSYPNYSATFIGNAVTGNSFGAYNDFTNVQGPYTLNFSGNSLSLFLPTANPSTNGIFYSSVYVWGCQNLNVCGNTMNSGGIGIYYVGSCSNSVILANNFSGVSFGGIEDFGSGSEVAQQAIGNTLSMGYSYHLKAYPWEGPNWFLYNNQFVNTNTVTVPVITDSPDLWAHITQ